MAVCSDKRRIVWRIHLRSRPERVFEMLATDDGRARFWAESAVEANGTIEFRFISGVSTMSPIIESTPATRYRLVYFNSDVTFDLSSDGTGGTDLTVTNTGFDPCEYEEIPAGWLNVLLPLKAACDFDIDLRSHDPTRTWNLGYVDQ